MKTRPRYATALLLIATLAVGVAAGRVLAEEGDMPQAPKQGKQHELMAQSVGEWDCYTKFWVHPSQPPVEGKDACTIEMTLDGWFMEMEYRGSWQGETWTGRLLGGYDQWREEYVNVWLTDHSPEMTISRGTMNDEGVLVMRGEMIDHTTGKPRMSETTFEYPDGDTSVMTIYWCTGDGARGAKMMEITYKRKKADAGSDEGAR